jgi:hypothetical protein
MILLVDAIHSFVIARLAAALVAANFNERIMVFNDAAPIEQFQPPAQEIELTLKNFTNDLTRHKDSAMLLELGAKVVVQSERSSPQIETRP